MDGREPRERVHPSLLRWTSKAGTENYGAASFTPVADGCDVEVKITYKTPRAIYAIVEGRRAQSIIRSLLRATLVRFGKKMEGVFPRMINLSRVASRTSSRSGGCCVFASMSVQGLFRPQSYVHREAARRARARMYRKSGTHLTGGPGLRDERRVGASITSGRGARGLEAAAP